MPDTRELTMDDYLAMARRRMKVVIVPLLIAPLAGFLISYVFPPKYTATTTVLVEGQKVSVDYVKPVVTNDLMARVNELTARILSASRLRPLVESLPADLTKPGEEDKLIEGIRANIKVDPIQVSPAATPGVAGAKKKPGAEESVPGFTVSYSDSNPKRAQAISNVITSQILEENLKSRVQAATSTSDFLDRQVEDAKRALEEQDAKLTTFKKQYLGQLPGDAENNMRTLMTLNSQLDATTQTLNRAQQDKTYAESMLAQQVAAWKNSQSSTSPQTLEQQLSALQTQLIQLEARYTDDYPDVVKTKADITKVQARLDEVNKQASNAPAASDKANANEPPEIRQLRVQIHQYQAAIDQATSDQKKLQAGINVFQGKTSMSPVIEQQYNDLMRGYDTAQKFYATLLGNKDSADLGKSMESQAQGEQMTLGQSAGLPDSPSFPNRPVMAAAGLGGGLAIGLLIAVWLEFSDKSIRTEKDAAVATDLPLLISVPWIGEEVNEAENGNGRRSFWSRGSPSEKDKDKVEV